MRAGFSCTFHKADQQGMGGWNIGSTQSRSDVEAIRKEHRDSLRVAALYAHERMKVLRACDDDEMCPALSPREHDCLAYLAAGLRTQQIADRLGIKPATVELHVRGARTTLNAQTREQALAKAISRGLIMP